MAGHHARYATRRQPPPIHEKGGKFHEVPAHHNAEAYLAAADIAGQPNSPLFRTTTGQRRRGP